MVGRCAAATPRRRPTHWRTVCSALLAAVVVMTALLRPVAGYELHRVDTLQKDERTGVTCAKSYTYALFRYTVGGGVGGGRAVAETDADSTADRVSLSVRTSGGSGDDATRDIAVDEHLTATQLGDFAVIECGDVHVHRAVDPHEVDPIASPYTAYAATCEPPHPAHEPFAATFAALTPSPAAAAGDARPRPRAAFPRPSSSSRPLSSAGNDVRVSLAGYLLPQLYPHNQTALARYIASHDPLPPRDALTFAVLTSFAMANFTATYVPAAALPQCRLRVLPSRDQALFPFVHLHITSTGAAANTDSAADADVAHRHRRRRRASAVADDGVELFAAPPRPLPVVGVRAWRDTHPLADTECDGCRLPHEQQRLEPSSAASSLHDAGHGLTTQPPLFVHIPTIRTHCHCAAHHVGYAAGSAAAAAARAAAHGASGGVSFIQTAAYMKLLGAALSGVMDIFTDTVMDIVGKGLEHTMNSEVTRTVNQRTPPQVLDLAGPPLRHNITNTVADAVVQKTVAALAKSMPLALGPYIVETVYDEVVPHAYNSLSKLLTQDISMELIRNLPTEVNRALSWSLTNKLSRSLTHALTATLTITLSKPTFPAERAPIDQIACTQCFYSRKQCELCHSSSQFVYYSIYYSTYYADYYSDYYTPYYTNAMKSVDETRNPDVHYSGDING